MGYRVGPVGGRGYMVGSKGTRYREKGQSVVGLVGIVGM